MKRCQGMLQKVRTPRLGGVVGSRNDEGGNPESMLRRVWLLRLPQRVAVRHDEVETCY